MSWGWAELAVKCHHRNPLPCELAVNPLQQQVASPQANIAIQLVAESSMATGKVDLGCITRIHCFIPHVTVRAHLVIRIVFTIFVLILIIHPQLPLKMSSWGAGVEQSQQTRERLQSFLGQSTQSNKT